jgi:4-alpha-glucanotransferase
VKWGLWSDPSNRDIDHLRSDNEEHYWREIIIQWKLEQAMKSIETHARENGVLILGDIPLYVAHDSADVWHSKELFNMGSDGEPLERSGAPPDSFNPLGQLWGNPTYAWSAHHKSGYTWWKKRVETAARRTPGIRIDHFIGLAEYWAIPPEAEDARGGRWAEGPGTSLMDRIIGFPNRRGLGGRW